LARRRAWFEVSEPGKNQGQVLQITMPKRKTELAGNKRTLMSGEGAARLVFGNAGLQDLTLV
jgi:hypothetical protein